MPHRKRNDTIHELHRETIRKQSGLLLSSIDAATLSLKNFTPHGQALAELRQALIQTENILHDRPRDFQRWNSTPGPRLEEPGKKRATQRRHQEQRESRIGKTNKRDLQQVRIHVEGERIVITESRKQCS